MTPTPNALFSSAPWATNGTSVSYAGGNVGVGMTSPNAAFSVVKSSAPEPSVQGYPVALKIGSPSGTIPFAFRQNGPESGTPTLAWFETSNGDLGCLSAATGEFILGAVQGKNWDSRSGDYNIYPITDAHAHQHTREHVHTDKHRDAHQHANQYTGQ